MSYILGALKKADQERRRESDVKISDWDQDFWNDPTPADNTSRWLIGLVGFGMVLVLIVFGFVAFRVLEAVPPAAPVAAVESEAIEGGQTEARAGVDEMPTGSKPYPSEATIASATLGQQEVNNQQGEMEKAFSIQDVSSDQDELDNQSVMPNFSGHLYFPGNSRLSRVFANSSTYREGETISGYRIEQILEDELVLSDGEQEIRINMRN